VPGSACKCPKNVIISVRQSSVASGSARKHPDVPESALGSARKRLEAPWKCSQRCHTVTSAITGALEVPGSALGSTWKHPEVPKTYK